MWMGFPALYRIGTGAIMGFLISLDKLTLWILFRKFPAEIMGYDFSLSLFFKTFLTLFFRVFFVVGFICSIFVHVKKFSGCICPEQPRTKRCKPLDNTKPRVTARGFVYLTLPKSRQKLPNDQISKEKLHFSKLLRNFLIYQVWGRAPIPPPSGTTPKHFILSEKIPIFAVHKDNLPSDTGELQIKAAGVNWQIIRHLQRLSFSYRTGTITKFLSLVGLPYVSVHKPKCQPQELQDQTQTKILSIPQYHYLNFLGNCIYPLPSPKGEAHKDKPCLRSMECYLASNILFTEHLLKHFP